MEVSKKIFKDIHCEVPRANSEGGMDVHLFLELFPSEEGREENQMEDELGSSMRSEGKMGGMEEEDSEIEEILYPDYSTYNIVISDDDKFFMGTGSFIGAKKESLKDNREYRKYFHRALVDDIPDPGTVFSIEYGRSTEITLRIKYWLDDALEPSDSQAIDIPNEGGCIVFCILVLESSEEAADRYFQELKLLQDENNAILRQVNKLQNAINVEKKSMRDIEVSFEKGELEVRKGMAVLWNQKKKKFRSARDECRDYRKELDGNEDWRLMANIRKYGIAEADDGSGSENEFHHVDDEFIEENPYGDDDDDDDDEDEDGEEDILVK